MFQKAVYSHEYIVGWKSSNETLPLKEEFYGSLTMRSVTDADYKHAKKVWEDFE